MRSIGAAHSAGPAPEVGRFGGCPSPPGPLPPTLPSLPGLRACRGSRVPVMALAPGLWRPSCVGSPRLLRARGLTWSSGRHPVVASRRHVGRDRVGPSPLGSPWPCQGVVAGRMEGRPPPVAWRVCPYAGRACPCSLRSLCIISSPVRENTRVLGRVSWTELSEGKRAGTTPNQGEFEGCEAPLIFSPAKSEVRLVFFLSKKTAMMGVECNCFGSWLHYTRILCIMITFTGRGS